ncbi:hypothetical protein BWU74_22350 [Paraburkholderia caledonica]|nr:hypothetical protein BWU74_22350 [Burkholderia sp. Bk]
MWPTALFALSVEALGRALGCCLARFVKCRLVASLPGFVPKLRCVDASLRCVEEGAASLTSSILLAAPLVGLYLLHLYQVR